MTIDYEHISHLFSIIEGCVNHTGKFGAIQNEAFNELGTINTLLHKAQMDRKDSDEKQLKDHQERQPKLIAANEPRPELEPGHVPVSEVEPDGIVGDEAPTLTERRI